MNVSLKLLNVLCEKANLRCLGAAESSYALVFHPFFLGTFLIWQLFFVFSSRRRHNKLTSNCWK